MNILSLLTHPHAAANLYDFLIEYEKQKSTFWQLLYVPDLNLRFSKKILTSTATHVHVWIWIKWFTKEIWLKRMIQSNQVKVFLWKTTLGQSYRFGKTRGWADDDLFISLLENDLVFFMSFLHTTTYTSWRDSMSLCFRLCLGLRGVF